MGGGGGGGGGGAFIRLGGSFFLFLHFEAVDARGWGGKEGIRERYRRPMNSRLTLYRGIL